MSSGSAYDVDERIAQARREGAAVAWDEGYEAGQAFGHAYAQDTYEGPAEDPTRNPYREGA